MVLVVCLLFSAFSCVLLLCFTFVISGFVVML